MAAPVEELHERLLEVEAGGADLLLELAGGAVEEALSVRKDGDSTAFKVDSRALRQVLVGGQALIDLKVGSKTRPVIVKDQQLHPVRDEVMHIDLLEVRLDEKIQTTVGVHVEGGEEAPGVKEGGVLEHVTHQLNIEALPTAIPDYIAVDVSGMAIAATMHLSEEETELIGEDGEPIEGEEPAEGDEGEPGEGDSGAEGAEDSE